VFQDMMDEDQELPASVVSTSGAVISETERRNSRTSECFLSLRFGPMFMRISFLSPPEEDTDDTGGRINEPFRGMCTIITITLTPF